MHVFSNRKQRVVYHIAFRNSHSPRSIPNHGPNHTTTIIIAVVASVGGLIVVLVFWQVYSRYSRRRNAAPLPPVQPLAHQREHQLASFAEHKAGGSSPALYNPSPSSRHSLLPVASDTSLLPHRVDSQGGPSRQNSSHTVETGDGSEDTSFVSHTGPLSPPNPGFYGSASPHPSSSSASLSSSGEAGSANPTSPGTPFSASSLPSRRSSQAPLNPRNRASMLSVSTTQTNRTSRSRSNVIRGAPHGPHSNIQIVLPTPLAPELYPHMVGEDAQGRRLTIGESGSEKRMSQVLTDKWIPVGNAAVGMGLPSTSQSARSDSGRGRPANGTTALPSGAFRRSTSNPPPASRLRQSTTPNPEHRRSSQALAYPPVPRVPSGLGLSIQAHDNSLPNLPDAHRPSSPPSSFPGGALDSSRSLPRKLEKKRSNTSSDIRPTSDVPS
ncbi:hypothetical protein DENSPDRAFT_833989 [Dentipellis sp. KUC8613]|nr:hypothetical protein DENSPDRAFT_833989 [Dentipellis sp. KUC8613]